MNNLLNKDSIKEFFAESFFSYFSWSVEQFLCHFCSWVTLVFEFVLVVNEVLVFL